MIRGGPMCACPDVAGGPIGAEVQSAAGFVEDAIVGPSLAVYLVSARTSERTS
jgi:hypothetical protein